MKITGVDTEMGNRIVPRVTTTGISHAPILINP
jgi:hypothetical protein